MLKKAFDFFVFTSLFIAVCAVLMVHQTALLFGLQLPFALYLFVFSGSVCSYNFHWYLTPPEITAPSYKLKWNIGNRRLHFVLFTIGLLGGAVASFLLLRHWMALCFTAGLTFLYSAPKIAHPLTIQLRRIAIGKTIFLAAAWAHVTAFLPMLVSTQHIAPPNVWFVVNRFFFIYAICIIFDRRDVEKDREAGIKSLVTFLSDKGVDRLFWFSILSVFVTSIILERWLPLTTVVLVTVPALVTALLYKRAKQSTSDYLYYFLLDGIMALSSAILILATFAR